MIDAAELERRYRRWLRWYPTWFRREHEAELLGVLMEGAREGQRQPDPLECLDLLRGAMQMRLQPHVPRSNRSLSYTVKLLYCGAAMELAAAITIVATLGDVRAAILARDPGLTTGEWHAALATQLEPTAVVAALAVGFWLLMAWSIGRGQRWARFAFVLFFAFNTWGLFNGLAGGSALYAPVDVAIGSVLWLLEGVAVALLFKVASAHARSSTRRVRLGGQ
jgi:hypothetical protein